MLAMAALAMSAAGAMGGVGSWPVPMTRRKPQSFKLRVEDAETQEVLDVIEDDIRQSSASPKSLQRLATQIIEKRKTLAPRKPRESSPAVLMASSLDPEALRVSRLLAERFPGGVIVMDVRDDKPTRLEDILPPIELPKELQDASEIHSSEGRGAGAEG